MTEKGVEDYRLDFRSLFRRHDLVPVARHQITKRDPFKLFPVGTKLAPVCQPLLVCRLFPCVGRFLESTSDGRETLPADLDVITVASFADCRHD